MSKFCGDILPPPDTPTILYSSPYQKPSYSLSKFEINYEDYYVPEDTSSEEKDTLKLKVSKILKLAELKKQENILKKEKEMMEIRNKYRNELNKAGETASELINYAADIFQIIFQDKKRADKLYDNLDRLLRAKKEQEIVIIKDDDDNLRCQQISSELASFSTHHK